LETGNKRVKGKVMAGLKDVHYDAFISYRHSEFDSFVVENLHKKLENFKLPKSVLSKVKSGKTRITRIFRDVDELPLADNLSDPINAALANSEFLICVCTPRYPESRWCMKEIEVFLKTHPRDHLLVLLAEDEPVNSFPEILNYVEEEVVDESGNKVKVRREIEPLAADTRGATRKEVLKAMDTAVIKLCAAIFGLNFDDLKQRHREQKMRRMAAIFGSIGAAVLGFAIFATCMLVKISRQYDELEDRFANTMATASHTLAEDGRRKDAVYAVWDVLPDTDNGKINGNALSALYSAMNVYKINPDFYPVCNYDSYSQVYDIDWSYDGKYLLTDIDFAIVVYDSETGEELSQIFKDDDNLSAEVFTASFCGPDGMIVSDDDEVTYYKIGSDKGTTIDIPAPSVLFSTPDTVVGVAGETLYGVGTEGEVLFKTDLSGALGNGDFTAEYFSFSDDLISLCISDSNNAEVEYIVVANRYTGEIVDSLKSSSTTGIEAQLADGVLYIGVSGVDAETAELYTDVMAYNLSSEGVEWKTRLEAFAFGEDLVNMLVTENYVYVTATYDVATINRADGSIVKEHTLPQPVVTAWAQDNIMMTVLTNTSVYAIEGDFSADLTHSFYAVAPTENLEAAYYSNGDLYYMFFRASYISKYSSQISERAELIEDYDVSGIYDDYKSADDEIWEDEEYDAPILTFDTAIYSKDEEFIVAMFSDHTVRVYDRKTKAVILSYITEEESYLSDMHYSDVTGSYIITGELYSRILDRNFNIISVVDRIVGEEDDCFILYSNKDYRFFKVPYVGYDEIMDETYKYLDGYEPEENIKEKYGLR